MAAKLLSILTVLGLFPPSVVLATAPQDLGDVLHSIYDGTGEEVRTIVRDGSFSADEQFQMLTNVLKTKHDAAIAAIQNTR